MKFIQKLAKSLILINLVKRKRDKIEIKFSFQTTKINLLH